MNEESRYGIAPSGYRLPAVARLGCVRLQVADLTRSVDFYQQVLGLTLLGSGSGRALLGVEGTTVESPLIELRRHRGAQPVPRGRRFGLYHFALLLPDRLSLARFLRHLVAHDVRPAMADHFVSEALYLYDPDGLGIEVYADRPRAAWRALGQEVWMTSDPLDVEGLVSAVPPGTWQGMPAGTTLGHMHLHVADLDEAGRFYHEGLGFDRTHWSLPGATFFSVGGYHHQVAINTWTTGAVPPADDEARLIEWEVVLPKPTDASAAARNIEYLDHAATKDHRDWLVRDPWGTTVRLRGERSAAEPTAGPPARKSRWRR